MPGDYFGMIKLSKGTNWGYGEELENKFEVDPDFDPYNKFKQNSWNNFNVYIFTNKITDEKFIYSTQKTSLPSGHYYSYMFDKDGEPIDSKYSRWSSTGSDLLYKWLVSNKDTKLMAWANKKWSTGMRSNKLPETIKALEKCESLNYTVTYPSTEFNQIKDGSRYRHYSDGDEEVVNGICRELLTNIKINPEVKELPNYIFCDFVSIQNITLPDGLESIGDSVFYECNNITSIFIPKSVVNVGETICRGNITVKIYCEAESKPDGWNDIWDRIYSFSDDRAEVHWGAHRQTTNEDLNDSDIDIESSTKFEGIALSQEQRDKFIDLIRDLPRISFENEDYWNKICDKWLLNIWMETDEPSQRKINYYINNNDYLVPIQRAVFNNGKSRNYIIARFTEEGLYKALENGELEKGFSFSSVLNGICVSEEFLKDYVGFIPRHNDNSAHICLVHPFHTNEDLTDDNFDVVENTPEKEMARFIGDEIFSDTIVVDNAIYLLWDDFEAYLTDDYDEPTPIERGIWGIYVIEGNKVYCCNPYPVLEIIEDIDNIGKEPLSYYTDINDCKNFINIKDFPQYMDAEFGRGWFGDREEYDDRLKHLGLMEDLESDDFDVFDGSIEEYEMITDAQKPIIKDAMEKYYRKQLEDGDIDEEGFETEMRWVNDALLIGNELYFASSVDDDYNGLGNDSEWECSIWDGSFIGSNNEEDDENLPIPVLGIPLEVYEDLVDRGVIKEQKPSDKY